MFLFKIYLRCKYLPARVEFIYRNINIHNLSLLAFYDGKVFMYIHNEYKLISFDKFLNM